MNRCRRMGLLMFCALLWFFTAGAEAEAALNFSGSFSSDLTLSQYEQLSDSDNLKYSDQNVLRLNLKEFINPNVKAEGSFDLILMAGEKADTYGEMFPDKLKHSFLKTEYGMKVEVKF